MERRRRLRYYPIALRLEGTTALIVGGGTVAHRKVLALLETGAVVKVVSPEAVSGLEKLAGEKKLEWSCRRVCQNDVAKADIVVAATNDASVNEAVCRWAKEDRKLINVVDNSALSSFISPAMFRMEQAIISVYTDAKDPVLSRDLKNFLKERWDDFLSFRDRL